MISAVSPYPALVIVLLALGTMRIMGKLLDIEPAKGRYAPIDGLRGYMAFFVFLHHSSIWYFSLRGARWGYVPSKLYHHLGPTSVAIFFMITAFLFAGKLIDARRGTIDWLKLYVSRVMRIMPLYAAAIAITVFIVMILTHFTLQEPLKDIIWELAKMMVFLRPDLNGFYPTPLITAWVTWSLAFEWLFYFTLVLLGRIFFSIRASPRALILSSLGLIFFCYIVFNFYEKDAWGRLSPFLGGIAAAFLHRNKTFCRLASGRIATCIILLCFVLPVIFYDTPFQWVPWLMLSTAFIGIACGNSLFGILTSRYSRLLGQISYSIYLLHGVVLFVMFRFVLGLDTAVRFSPLEHWIYIAWAAVGVVVLCCLTYKWIELPGMRAAGWVTKKLRRTRTQ